MHIAALAHPRIRSLQVQDQVFGYLVERASIRVLRGVDNHSVSDCVLADSGFRRQGNRTLPWSRAPVGRIGKTEPGLVNLGESTTGFYLIESYIGHRGGICAGISGGL